MSGVEAPELRHGLYHLQGIKCPIQIKGLVGGVRRLDEKSAEYSLKVLNNGFQQILKRQFSHLEFEALYRNAYYLVMHKYGAFLYASLRSEISDHILHKVQPKVLISLNRNFLHVLNRAWDNHHGSMVVIRDTLMYLDRVYTEVAGLEDVYSLGLGLFRDLIVYHKPIRSHLQDTLLRLVMVERHGELIDRASFRSVTRMLKVLGGKESEVYNEIFEAPFLLWSAEYFKEESQKILSEKNVPLYILMVQHMISLETERSEQCYDEQTMPKLTKVAEHELIRAHMNTIVEMEDSGVVHMMKNGMTEDLARTYSLLSRVPEGLSTMFSCTSNYLIKEGLKLNRDENGNENAFLYIQNLLDLKDRYDFYLYNSFASDKNFKKVISTDFEAIINQNSKSPEYLSLFIDDKLRKAARGTSEVDRATILDKTLVLFRFLQDKDLFQQYYEQHLAKRLLAGKGFNEDSEKEVITKFMVECGSHYTRKMEGMFRDMRTSGTLTEQFRKYVSDAGESVQGVEMSLRVLTAVYWPTQSIPPPCSLPATPFAAFETFRKYYLQKHCGRQLTLLPHLGSAEVETFLVQSCEEGEGWYSAQTQPCGEIRSYTLQVTTYQMCVLMLFNDRPHLTFQELHAETNIQPKDLQRALQSLVMGKPSQKVLLKQPDTRDVNVGDSFFVNAAFTSKSNKVKITPYQVKYETDSERQDKIKTVNEGRHLEVEAAIIRIMKANRVMNHDNLLNEVMDSLRQRFVPSKDFVKMRIEILIEREYISRHPSSKRVYIYNPN